MIQRLPILGVLILTAVALATCGGPPKEAPGPPAVVTLKYDAGATPCMTLDPATPVTIYVSTRGPHNVTWKKQDPEEQHEWVIAQKAQDGGPGSMGGKTTFTIPCNGKQIPSANASKEGDWNYSVTVKSCVKGQPTETLCSLDPKIIIYP